MRQVRDQLPPARPRRVRRGRAADRPRHRHRADARRVRDDRARARACTSRRYLETHHGARRARAGARRARASASSPAPAPARRSRSGRSPRRSSARRRCASAWSTASARRRPRRRRGTSSSSPPASRGAGSRTATSCRSDTLIVDEIHQTSAELELCLALGKRVGLPLHLAVGDGGPDVLRAATSTRADVLEVFAFDPTKAAHGEGDAQGAARQFLDDKFLQQVVQGEARRRACSCRRARASRRRREHVRERCAAHQRRVLSRRRADPRHPAVPRGRRARSRTSSR